ncbi:MAG: hypothetical protein IJV98_04220 [Clostridia bacterium]|nr:hypothetical protein [Clostridia bacterium]
MTVKYAFRNLRRLLWRTVLYTAMIGFIVASVTAALAVRRATERAEEALHENYVFVASLVKRENTRIPLSEVFKCLGHESIKAFNISMSEAEGTIPAGRAMVGMPDMEEKGEKREVWIEEFGCNLSAVENLALTYPFFSGECTIREGTGLTHEGYRGAAQEIVIPWWLADTYGIGVGDTVNRRYVRPSSYYGYLPCKVVGIYESNAISPDLRSYPAYIPLAVAELDYGQYLPGMEKPTVERADFVLGTREDFEAFVAYATENGLNFKTVDLVFNNSTYDVLSSELGNIHTITVLVFWLVLIIGCGLIAFVTVYLCHSRKAEGRLLRALGMKGYKIGLMIATELCVLFIFATVLGFLGGGLTADGICRHVNDTVLTRASASEIIRDLQSSEDFNVTMPLEKNMKIELSITSPRVSRPDVEMNMLYALSDEEIGFSRHRYYVMMTAGEAEIYLKYGKVLTEQEQTEFDYIWNERPLNPSEIVGVSDLSLFDLNTVREYTEDAIRLYVSENSPYAKESAVFLSAYDRKSYTQINIAGMSAIITQNVRPPSSSRYEIVGTYRENEYCSGDDILVSMEDYHKIYSYFSVTEENACFQRIHEIQPKEAE